MKSFKFYTYAPMVFRRIRKTFGIIEQDYMQSFGHEQVFAAFFHKNFDYLKSLLSTGKSGSLFYYSKDNYYMVKEIHATEFEKFR